MGARQNAPLPKSVNLARASQRVFDKAGFTKEGIIRKSAFIRGEWRDDCLFSILREEWSEPKIPRET
jgi:RimJ/RimL family protein N-acetyltransferase